MSEAARARPMVIAHRGASGYRPEHSRSAYLLAIELGADAVEPDLVPTRDGVLVIRHENEISGTTDVASRPEFAGRRTTKIIEGQKLTGWFTEDFDWSELSTLRVTERLPKVRPKNRDFEGDDGILRLVDLLELLDAAPPVVETGRRVELVAELKHASYFDGIGLPLDELFAAELARAGWDDDPRLIVESFETTVLGRVRDRGIRARYVFLLEASGGPADRPDRSYADYLTDEGLAALADSGLQGISVNKQLLLTDAAASMRTDAAGSANASLVDRAASLVDRAHAPTLVHRDRASALVDRAHAAGLTVFVWTLRAENHFLARELRMHGSDFGRWQEEFALIFATGVDGVFADQPDLALEARATM